MQETNYHATGGSADAGGVGLGQPLRLQGQAEGRELQHWPTVRARLPTEVGGVSFRKGEAGKEGLSPWQGKEMGLLRRDDWIRKSLNSEGPGES